MTNNRKLSALAMLGLLSVAGCGDGFLKGGDLTVNPNQPLVATTAQRFQGIEVELWSLLGSDIPRETGILSQQFFGNQSQYKSLQTAYTVDPNTTNGAHSGLYGGGGLIDIATLEKETAAAGDSIFLGIAQVQEGLLMGTGADLFGDLVYSQALSGKPNPMLDDQLAVYDSVQKVLSAAIVNLATTKSVANTGPGTLDRVYNGSPARWSALAHTLKARFYLHTAEVRPGAYASALAEAKLGIMSDAGNYVGAFTSNTNEKNFYYQFNVEAGRSGYVIPNPFLNKLLLSRKDPRNEAYFALDTAGKAVNLSATRLAADYRQPFVTYDENTLIWAEAAYRTGDYATALAKLNQERMHNGLSAETVVGSDPTVVSGSNSSVVTGTSLLNEILLEEYISDFQLGIESFNLYKRTCTPNLVPTVKGQKIPRRLFYDTSEQQTDTNIPPAGTGANGFANKNDPANATSDGTGAVCVGQ